jgi:hypothetical protein
MESARFYYREANAPFLGVLHSDIQVDRISTNYISSDYNHNNFYNRQDMNELLRVLGDVDE